MLQQTLQPSPKLKTTGFIQSTRDSHHAEMPQISDDASLLPFVDIQGTAHHTTFATIFPVQTFNSIVDTDETPAPNSDYGFLRLPRCFERSELLQLPSFELKSGHIQIVCCLGVVGSGLVPEAPHTCQIRGNIIRICPFVF